MQGKFIKRKSEQKKRLSQKAGIYIMILALCVAGLSAFFAGVYQGKIRLAERIAQQYTIRGMDVSYYQGEISWQTLAGDMDFVYIKATEGSGHQDIKLEQNLEGARETELAVGAYHFFSFESSGMTQAANYITTVGRWDGMLVPAVDVEYYAGMNTDYIREEVQKELRVLLEELEAYYGKKPVIYTTMSTYNELIRGEFNDYPLWIRNIYFQPVLWNAQWTLWQYSDHGELEGYYGESRYIDLDVFYKGREEFEEILRLELEE